MEEYKHFERPTTKKPEFPIWRNIQTMLLIAGVGLVTGAVGFTFVALYLFPSLDIQSGAVTTRPIASVNIDQDYSNIVNSLTPSSVAIYRATDLTRPFSELPRQQDYVGAGLVVTSDGWAIASKGIISSPLQSYIAYIDGTVYDIADIVVDDFSNTAFLKLEANFLTPVAFSNALPAPAETLLAYSNKGPEGFVFSIAHVAQPQLRIANADKVFSSGTLAQYISLVNVDLPSGATIFNTKGELVGLSMLGAEGLGKLAVPSYIVKSSLDSILRGKGVKDLGITYLDYSFQEEEKNPYGVIVYHPFRNPITFGSIASKAGLKAEDRIININGDSIEGLSSFDRLWYQLTPEQDISLGVLRDDEELTLTIPADSLFTEL